MDDTLIAEDLLLLLLDDESGKLQGTSFIEIALGGALLLELSTRGAVALTDKQTFRQQKVLAIDVPLLPPLLADALADIDDKERTAISVISRLGRHRKPVLLERLEARGILRSKNDKVVGLFPRTRWPAEDSRHEDEVRRKIRQALIAQHPGDERTGALLSLLSAMGIASKVIEIDGISKRDLNKRAKVISEGTWASEAVRDAVAASQAAILAAVSASVAASSS